MTSARARPDVDDLVVRDALVAAVEVARREIDNPDADPTATVPRPLWRICGFRNLSKSALAQIRSVLDADDDFRTLVAANVTIDDVDEPSWLFLHRPEGWTDAIAAAVGRRSERDDDDPADADRAGRRKLRAAESARKRAEEAAEARRARLEQATADLERARQERTGLEEELREVREALQDAQRAVSDAEARIRIAEGKRAEEAHRVQQVTGARDQLRIERDELRREVEELRSAAAKARLVDPPGDILEAPVHGAGPGTDPGVADAVEAAAAAASSLAASLSDAARRLRPPPSQTERPPPGESTAGAGPRGRRERRGGASRRPVPLPPGVFDDSVEAAQHIVSAPGMVLFVDGYNATIGRWPELSIEEQRRRLLAAVTELHSRCGPRVHVVFDGAEAAARHRTAGRGVSVIFTEEGREADDAIIDAVASVGEGPVTVASDDRRVREGAARAGANLLTLDQLFAVLRREA